MKHTMRILTFLMLALVVGAGQTWARLRGDLGYIVCNQANVIGGTLTFYTDESCENAIEFSGDKSVNLSSEDLYPVLVSEDNLIGYKVYIKVAPDVAHTLNGYDIDRIRIEKSLGSGSAQAPRRSSAQGPETSSLIDAECVDEALGIYWFTMPTNCNVTVSATFPEKAKATDVSYIGGTAEEAYVLDGTEFELGTSANDTWYVCDDDLEYSHGLTLAGTVHLIVADGYTLTVDGTFGSDGKTLTLYGQEYGNGALTATNYAGTVTIGPGNRFVTNYNSSEKTANGIFSDIVSDLDDIKGKTLTPFVHLLLDTRNTSIIVGNTTEPDITIGGIPYYIYDVHVGNDVDLSYTGEGMVRVTANGEGASIANQELTMGTSDVVITTEPITVEDIHPQDYTGDELTPEIIVRIGDERLVENTDYTYEISGDHVDAGDYEVTITGIGTCFGEVTKTFTIDKAPLTVTANDHTINYGEAPTNGGVEYNGFVNGEDENTSNIFGESTLTYAYNKQADGLGDTYTTSSPVDRYYIIPYGLTSNNYNIIFQPGMLIVNQKATISVDWEDNNNVDGLRPGALEFKLLADGNDTETYTLSASNGWTATVNGLTAYNGETLIPYTWSLETPPEYVNNYESNDNQSTSNTGATATFTLTRKTGSLTVSNTLVSDLAADADVEFTYTVKLTNTNISGTYSDMTFTDGEASVTLKAGESATATGLLYGTTYTVTQADAEGFTNTGKTGDTGTISTTQSEAAFTNTRQTGDLIVTNTVISELSADSDVDFTFTVTLSDTSINGTYDEMDFEGGEATFTLKAGENKTATGLPTTVEYTVTQTANDDFSTTKAGDTGTISTTQSVAEFTNTRETGSLKVTNTVVSDLAADADAEFDFTVTLDDTTINGTYGGMTFTDGGATVTLKGGESAEATGLPTDLTYTVTREDATGFQLTGKTGDTGTISTTQSVAEFTNTRETGSLKVTNTVVSDLAADADAEFDFTVTLDDTTINGTYGGMMFVDGKATFTLKGGEDKTAEGLPTTLSYTVTQDDADGFETDQTEYTGEISTTQSQATFTNTRQMFTITFKNWDGTELSSATYTYGTAAADIEQPDPLPTKAANAEYTYTFKGWTPEIVQVTGDATYTATYNEIVEKTQVSVDAFWDDNNNAEGFRPDNITVKLMANGNEVGTTTLNADNEWNYTFTGLNKYFDGQEIEYTLRQDQLVYYKTPVIEKVSETEWEYTVTNSRDIEETEATVKVVWVDADDELGNRPESVTATLVADGTATDITVLMNAENDWTATAEQLNKYKNGTGIDYTWTLAALNDADYELATPSTEGTTTTFTYNYYPAVTVTITGNNNETTYDGTEHVVNGYEVTNISYSLYTADYFTFKGEASASQTNAGTAYMGLEDTQFTNTNPNYDGKVEFVIAADGYQTITPAPVTVKADDKSKVWGTADDPTLTATVTGMVNDENASTLIDYTIDRATGTITDGVENSGEYTITPTGDATQGNYAVTYETGTFTIEGKPVTIQDAEGHDVSSVENAYTITQDQDGVTLTLVVPVTLDETPTPPTVDIPVAVEVDRVEIERTFIANRASTVYLPFPIKAGNVSGGKFHTFTNVDETTTPWTVEYSVVTGDIEANTPYIFIPDGSNGGKIVVNNGTDKVTVCTANQHMTENGQWDFIGTYKRIMWTHNTSDPEYTTAREAEIGSIYGFAAEEKSGATIGQFVKVTDNVWIDPMRAYLKNLSAVAARSMNGETPTTELPDAMKVVIVDGNGETTSLTPALPTSLGLEGSGYYTLDGRKLDKKPTAKGIYIHNGRKEVIK